MALREHQLFNDFWWLGFGRLFETVTRYQNLYVTPYIDHMVCAIPRAQQDVYQQRMECLIGI